MISGAHVVIYSKDAEADRAFFRNVLGLKSVDAGHGWLIFGLRPGEVAFHPSAGPEFGFEMKRPPPIYIKVKHRSTVFAPGS
jgi:catechol 2,3-dioxygenase-like lactoylglutathione lyase family enzyme